MHNDNMDFGADFGEEDNFRWGRCSVGQRTVYLEFDQVLKETGAAWFVRFPMKDDLTNDDIWFPKSQCDIPDAEQKIIEVPQWLVDEKDISEYEVDQ
jgi:hypothetical protein